MRRTFGAVVCIVLLVLTGCSKRPDRKTGDVTSSENDALTSAAPGATDAAAGSSGSGSSGGRSSATIGGKPAPAGFLPPAGQRTINRNSYQGVTDKLIQLVTARQSQPCGQDPDAIIQQALPNADPEASIQTAYKWFSNPKRAFKGQLPDNLLDQLGTGYFGRTVKLTQFTEDHGDFCPEQSRNDAKATLAKYKPFAVLGGSGEWDAEASKQKLIKVTGTAATDKYFKDHAPYLWGPITGASTINRLLAGYVKTRLAGKNAKNTGDALRVNGKKRVFGIVYLDTPEGNQDKSELVSELKKRGVSVPSGAVVGYEPKLSTIAVQARNIVAQLIAAKVTSILMVMDPIAVQFISQEADRQQPAYLPEWISNSYGLMDWSLGPRSFMSVAQAKNVFGISAFWPSKQLRDNETEHWKAWTALNPNKDMPSDFQLTYLSFKVLFRGLAMAGPYLTPNTFAAGYHTFCAPCVRTAAYMPLTGYGPGDYTDVDDAHIQHYDPNAPDYTAARCRHSTDENCDEWDGNTPPKGAYVYDEGGKRFTSFG
jgi:hypothetical protein